MTDIAPATVAAPIAERLEKLCVAFTRPIAFIGVLGMLIVASATVVDVLMRWLASTAITALNEITALVFAVAVAACIPAGLASGVNLRIDLLARWLTGRVAAWLDALGALLLLLFFCILAWRIGVFAGNLMDQGRTTVILGWPQAPFMYAVSVLLGIGALVQAVVAVNAIGRAFGRGAIAEKAQALPVVTTIVLVVSAAVFATIAFGLVEFAWLSRWATQNIGAAVTIAFIVMWLLMLGQVPLAAVMGLTGIFGSALFIGFAPAVSAFATEATTFLTNTQVATLAVVPHDGKLRGGVRHVGRHVSARARAAQPLSRGARARDHRRLRRLRRADRLVARDRGDDRTGGDPGDAGAGLLAGARHRLLRGGRNLGADRAAGLRADHRLCAAHRGLDRPIVRGVGRTRGAHHPALFHHRDDLCARRAGFGANDA